MGAMNIAPGLEPFLVDVESLSELPGNPRRGDVEAVKRSYERFGQRKPIVARRDGKQTIVVAGNHQLRAAKELGWEQIAVVFADDLTDDEARGYALADNRVGELGAYDSEDLLSMLDEINGEDLVTATGYSDADIEALRRAVDAASVLTNDWQSEWVEMPEFISENREPVFSTTVSFFTDEAVVEFFRLIDKPKSKSVFLPEHDGLLASQDKAWITTDDA